MLDFDAIVSEFRFQLNFQNDNIHRKGMNNGVHIFILGIISSLLAIG